MFKELQIVLVVACLSFVFFTQFTNEMNLSFSNVSQINGSQYENLTNMTTQIANETLNIQEDISVSSLGNLLEIPVISVEVALNGINIIKSILGSIGTYTQFLTVFSDILTSLGVPVGLFFGPVLMILTILIVYNIARLIFKTQV